MTLKGDQKVTRATLASEEDASKGYRKIKVPAVGVNLVGSDVASRQIKMDV